MPSTRIAFQEVQSWTPAIEAKAVENGSLFVLSGKNFVFDSKGPKSGFGSTVLPAGRLQETLDPVESIEFSQRSVVFTCDKALERRWSDLTPVTLEGVSVEYWYELGTFATLYAPDPKITRWTQAFVGYTNYICHSIHGVYKLESDQISTFAGVGAPEDPIGIIETNGRMVILSKFTVNWSAPFNGEDFTPALGGGGFQITAELLPGNPTAITTFESGFIVWSDAGMLLAEYTGDDAVFRYDRVNTDQLLLNGVSWTTMNDGSTIICTKQGLYRSNERGSFVEVTPIFNEFLRPLITRSEDWLIRMVYIQEADHLYLQIMDGTSYYNHTYVLSLKLDKWGEFSIPHAGICRFSEERDDYGYVCLDGYPHKFAEVDFIENQFGVREGLNSEIILGFIRPAAQSTSADVDFEMQEIITTAVTKSPESAVYVEEDWGGDYSFESFNIGFYANREDWNLFSPLDLAQDWNFTYVDEDWDLPGPAIDYDLAVVGTHQFDWNDPGMREDWGATPENSPLPNPNITYEDWMEMVGDEDWSGRDNFLNQYSYQLAVYSNLDGFEDEILTIPELAVARSDSDFWTMFSYGHNHKLKFAATQVGEKYHMRSLEITLHLAGQLS